MITNALKEIGTIAGWTAALIIALGVLHRFGLGVWRTARRIEDTHTHVQRIPAIEAYGVETRLLLNELSKLVNYELRPNGGGSLYDKVSAAEERTRPRERRGRAHTDTTLH